MKKKINKKKRGEKRLRYGKQNYFRLPPCDVKLCTKICEKKRKKMKRSSALSTLQNGSFGKGTLRFSFFFSSILLERINLKLLTSE